VVRLNQGVSIFPQTWTESISSQSLLCFLHSLTSSHLSQNATKEFGLRFGAERWLTTYFYAFYNLRNPSWWWFSCGYFLGTFTVWSGPVIGWTQQTLKWSGPDPMWRQGGNRHLYLSLALLGYSSLMLVCYNNTIVCRSRPIVTTEFFVFYFITKQRCVYIATKWLRLYEVVIA